LIVSYQNSRRVASNGLEIQRGLLSIILSKHPNLIVLIRRRVSELPTPRKTNNKSYLLHIVRAFSDITPRPGLYAGEMFFFLVGDLSGSVYFCSTETTQMSSS
jgi:hypothetical protein